MIIEKSYTLPFSVAQTYAAWVSSDTVIAPATRMEVKPIVGGLYELFIESDDITAHCEGLFDIIEPDSRVRYTWQWDGDNEISVIDVSFKADSDGTKINLRHSGFMTQESCDKHDKGWDSYINGFTEFLDAQS